MAINSKISKISEQILFLKTYGARAIYSNLRGGIGCEIKQDVALHVEIQAHARPLHKKKKE